VRDEWSNRGTCHLARQAQMVEEMRRLALDARLPLSSLG